MGSQRVALRPAARVGVIASSLALLAMLISPNPTFAATTIGSAVGDVTCNLQVLDSVQLSSSDPTISYKVPAGGGVIDSWSAQSTGQTGLVGLEVWRPTATAGTYLLVGASQLATPTGAAIPITPTITVQAGDLIGLHVEGTAACGHATSSGLDTWAYGFGPTPATGGTEALGPPSGSFRLNVTANVTAAPAPPGTGCDSSGASSGDDQCDQSKAARDAARAAARAAEAAAEKARAVAEAAAEKARAAAEAAADTAADKTADATTKSTRVEGGSTAGNSAAKETAKNS